MPRNPRQLSRTGVYHIIVRGINRQTIFFEDDDYQRYIETIGRFVADARNKGTVLMLHRMN